MGFSVEEAFGALRKYARPSHRVLGWLALISHYKHSKVKSRYLGVHLFHQPNSTYAKELIRKNKSKH
jgi:hypothetical protein